eukprot:2259783-Pyramimonas_sp.AAC.1
MKSRHSWENKEWLLVPCQSVAGNELCRSGSANGSVPEIEVGVPPPIGHQLVQYDTCSPYVVSISANPSSRSSCSQIHPWAAEPPEG